ncbi:MAG: hypothetical protein HQL90_16195 [Magnetococcales bacterium]|nr:hypothetical protein [Magnetococcales bacterium]
MSDINHPEPAHPLQRRGTVDPVMERQFNSEHHFFRVIGELRYLLGALIHDGHPNARWDEFAKRTFLHLRDPSLIDKVAAHRLLDELYHDVPGNPEMTLWLEGQLSRMDPLQPEWMLIKEHADRKEYGFIKEMKDFASFSSYLMFLELCQACDETEKTMDCLVKGAAPALLALALGTPPIPPPGMDARKRHMKNMEENPEYRQMVESTMEMTLQGIAKDPRIMDAMRESMCVASDGM